MRPSKISELIGRVYDYVEVALWATLFAFVIYFVVFTIPNMREIRAQNERTQVQEITVENALYCEKFGMKVGTEKHNQCLLDLAEFRTKVEKRMHDDCGLY